MITDIVLFDSFLLSSTLLSLGYVTKKSYCTTPRVFSLMRMMSHHNFTSKSSLFTIPEVFCDDGWGYHPKLMFFFVGNVQSCVDFLIVLFMDCVQILGHCSFYGKCPILVNFPIVLGRCPNPGHGTKIARGWDWYTDIGYCSLGFTPEFLYLVPQGESWSRHQNCKRIG